MDRHLSVFLPYERPPHHEDQLTRAAMIVLRAVPLARDALLARIDAPVGAQLPKAEIGAQTRYVREPHVSSEGEQDSAVDELISVFRSPDEGLDLSGVEIEERTDEQRLDGVLRFGDQLVVVIESKIVGAAPSEQAEQLRLRGVEVGRSRVKALGWHELLADWWSLLERAVLSPAERVLVEDLVAMAEHHFPHLLPFTTLRRAGDHELRLQRRLAALLREATGIQEIKGELRPRVGAFANASQPLASNPTVTRTRFPPLPYLVPGQLLPRCGLLLAAHAGLPLLSTGARVRRTEVWRDFRGARCRFFRKDSQERVESERAMEVQHPR